ncbi:TetR family transcriptional regulator [Microbispora rosea subsp. aerata]|nr:TetR/AcrR family transcriptional regulator [Microbispora rosea]GGO22942.1 TetR family transcriptional regulator [Microbispora rosea subsp. aerata]GIH58969.1 TetR family transcriptional regulator [Microbispora rosea subsp. aerata]GLJ85834.1 TetR family transcriptional regulator [Microbispora rosea subsp. aerata]
MTPTQGRRRLPLAERREEILKAATELIAAVGFKGVTLEAFAAACGMTKAGLLHHFRSREELLIAVLERRDTLDLTTVVDTLEPAPDPAAARAVMTGFVRRNLAQRSLVQLYTVLSAEALDPAHPAHAYFQTRLRDGRAMLERYLLAWHPRPGQAAVDLLAFLDGLQLNWLRDPDIDFLAQWETFADRFFDV